jgi:hypothetical protein
MKNIEQLSVRVPEGTKARLRALAGTDETLVSTLLRAIDLLEQQTDQRSPLERIEHRLTHLEHRVRHLQDDRAGFDRDILLELMGALDRAWKAKNGLRDYD